MEMVLGDLGRCPSQREECTRRGQGKKVCFHPQESCSKRERGSYQRITPRFFPTSLLLHRKISGEETV